MPFDYSALRRFPDVEAPNLQAWDATDELLVQWALDSGIRGEQIAVIGDEYGAITLALTAAGLRGIRVHQDLVTGRRALARNAATFGIPEPGGVSGLGAGQHAVAAPDAPGDDTRQPAYTPHELDPSLLDGARLVLLQLPKALAELEEIADAVARWAEPDVILVAGGRVKHMTLAQNEVLGRYFAEVQPQRAERKSRLIVASGALSVPATEPFPISQTHHLASAGEGALSLTLSAYGGAFAGPRIDIGTRVLLDVVACTPTQASNVIDLGCGTGALAAAFALQHPDAAVTATDRSATAVRSAQATMVANGLAGRVTVTLDDAGSELPAGGADIILLNPPFHLGASVHEGAGQRLIQAAARLLKPGGEVWTVFNSHLDHRRALAREVGTTGQILRTPKFTVTRSIRRSE